MGTVVLRPNVLTYQSPAAQGSYTTVGAANAVAALTDNSDASYVEITNTGGSFELDFTFAAGTFPANSQIRTVTVRVRSSDSVGSKTVALQTVLNSLLSAGSNTSLITVGTAIQSYSGTNFATAPGGSAWTTTKVADITADFRSDPPNSSTRFYELYLDVVYNEAPVVTVTVPANLSTITNDSTPDVSWTVADPESDAQERYQLKVFSAAQYGAGGFDPETSAATFSSGEVLSAGTTATVTTVLPNATYRAYVKVADVGSSGRYGAWAFTTFTLNVVPPPIPTLTTTVDGTLKKVTLTATSTGTPTVEFFDFEFSDSLGVTWSPVRNGTRVTATSNAATVVDYESPPNVARQYRARAGRLV